MANRFQINDPSLESQWRSLILFGKNSATYKFSFGKALLDLVDKQKTRISLQDLSVPYALAIVEHLKKTDKQGSSKSSDFLTACRQFKDGQITQDVLFDITVKKGFNNVIDAFQNIDGGLIPNPFYEKNFKKGNKEIVITDSLLKMKELHQYQNLDDEVESRWSLVETAWRLGINPNLLEVKHDETNGILYIESDLFRRIDITSSRGSLNGYQKGKCFYSFQDLSIVSSSINVCQVDHFLPHKHKLVHSNSGANINGVWNLVLADKNINREKSAKIPHIDFLERLYNRNEFFVSSKHPLSETIVKQGPHQTTEENFFRDNTNPPLIHHLKYGDQA